MDSFNACLGVRNGIVDHLSDTKLGHHLFVESLKAWVWMIVIGFAAINLYN